MTDFHQYDPWEVITQLEARAETLELTAAQQASWLLQLSEHLREVALAMTKISHEVNQLKK